MSKPQGEDKQEVGPSNSNNQSEAVKAPQRKMMSTQTQRHVERKRQRLTAEERRRERQAAMIIEKQDQEKDIG